jgi:hypothetical protein
MSPAQILTLKSRRKRLFFGVRLAAVDPEKIDPPLVFSIACFQNLKV